MITRLEDLRIWQLAREINYDVFQIITNQKIRSGWPLRDQLNRSVASVMDNIAEGYGRNGKREFIQFLSISKASCVETKSQLFRTIDRLYIDKTQFDFAFDKVDHLEKMLTKMIDHLRKLEGKGWKFDST